MEVVSNCSAYAARKFIKQKPNSRDKASRKAEAFGVILVGISGGDFKVKNGHLRDRLYVPVMSRFCPMRKHHDDIGHPGFVRCLALVKVIGFLKWSDLYVSMCGRV